MPTASLVRALAIANRTVSDSTGTPANETTPSGISTSKLSNPTHRFSAAIRSSLSSWSSSPARHCRGGYTTRLPLRSRRSPSRCFCRLAVRADCESYSKEHSNLAPPSRGCQRLQTSFRQYRSLPLSIIPSTFHDLR